VQIETPKIDFQLIQKKIAGQQLTAALADLTAVLENDPAQLEALYLTALCHRYLSNPAMAQSFLDQLKKLSPDHSRAHQEQGHLYRSTGKLDFALQSYGRACQLNPALEASWKAQLDILASHGQAQSPQSQQLTAQLQHLQGLPKALIAVTDLIAQGKLIKAENICREFLKRVPHHPEAMRLLADIGTRLGSLDDAEFLLESAVEFAPSNTQLRIDYIQVLRKRQKFSAALAQAKTLLDREPENLQFQSIYAIEAMQTGDYATALQLFDGILKLLPEDPITLTSKGHALKTCGRQQDAITAYHAAISSRPQHCEAFYSLANLKTYAFSKAEITAMHQQLDNDQLSHMERVHLSFALGKAYEDQQDFATSFSYYQQGNQLKKAQSGYNADQMSEELQLQQSYFTPAVFEKHSDTGHPAPDPIFIVGLPRAGSTMLEQILSSHSQVDGTLELPNIISLAQKLRRKGSASSQQSYPFNIDDLSPDELQKFGEEYIRDTRIHRQGGVYFTDKMPNNFRHIGLIQLILPNAKIIDARRHPMACCFSGYKQLFAEGQEFSYDLADIAQYYRDYEQLMQHWDQVLPGKILRVHYEAVVADLETEVRRLLDFCGLPFEPACLDFHNTERHVRTASSEQVRQPVNRKGLDQWQAFSEQLTGLSEQLQDLNSAYPVKSI
jgi:tetratricopeptide (TPR) repeat protein